QGPCDRSASRSGRSRPAASEASTGGGGTKFMAVPHVGGRSPAGRGLPYPNPQRPPNLNPAPPLPPAHPLVSPGGRVTPFQPALRLPLRLIIPASPGRPLPQRFLRGNVPADTKDPISFTRPGRPRPGGGPPHLRRRRLVRGPDARQQPHALPRHP